MRANRTPLRLIAATAVAGAVGIAAAAPAVSAPPEQANERAGVAVRGHVRDLPAFVQKWQAERARATSQVSTGRARLHGDGAATLESGEVVSFGTTEEAYILTVLAEFSDLPHGQLAVPDADDNSTYYPYRDEIDPAAARKPGYTGADHYVDLLYGDGTDGNPSMRDVYLEMSSGRHLIDGEITEWVQLPETQAYYGADSGRGGAGSDDRFGPVYYIVRDAIAQLTASDYAEDADVWDRYDCDGDGTFLEPDGYVDHFQVVHAGPGQEAGASSDTIWSHRWYANGSAYGAQGPTAVDEMGGDDAIFGDDECLLGGYPVGGSSNLWVGDYTVEPEDGGVGVFVHEYAHDWGIPDFYDTAGGENGSGFWTLMSSGSWAAVDEDAIGTNPVPMGAPEKEQLGWYEPSGAGAGALEVVEASSLATTATFTLGPATTATNVGAQALRISLPENQAAVEVFPQRPRDDTPGYWYSTAGDELDVALEYDAGPGLLTFAANYDIEKDWDYAYVEATSDGTIWTPLQVNGKSSRSDPNGQNLGHGITGTTHGRWSSARVTLPADTTAVRFRYVTDVAVAETGFAVDGVAVDGVALAAPVTSGTDFVEIAEGSSYSPGFEHYYLVELRDHVEQDSNLCGVYNFSFGTNQVEKNCYAEGVLVWYVNTYHLDNNTSQHPGAGLALPVDLGTSTLTTDAGSTLRGRLQVWDAPLTLAPEATTEEQSFALTGGFAGSWAVGDRTVFDDAGPNAYFNAALPFSSLRTAGSGIVIELTDRTDHTATLDISKPPA